MFFVFGKIKKSKKCLTNKNTGDIIPISIKCDEGIKYFSECFREPVFGENRYRMEGYGLVPKQSC